VQEVYLMCSNYKEPEAIPGGVLRDSRLSSNISMVAWGWNDSGRGLKSIPKGYARGERSRFFPLFDFN